jgi:hypothetical protein
MAPGDVLVVTPLPVDGSVAATNAEAVLLLAPHEPTTIRLSAAFVVNPVIETVVLADPSVAEFDSSNVIVPPTGL